MGKLGKLFGWNKRPVFWFYAVMVKILILPLLEKYLWLKNKLTKRAPHFKDWVFVLAVNRFLIYVFLILLALGVVTSNLLAYEGREDYGQKALINKIANVGEQDMVEDSNSIVNDYKVYSYQEESNFLDAGLAAEPSSQEDLSNQTAQLMIAPGGTAIIKPSSIEQGEANRRSISEYLVIDGDSIGKVAVKFGISVNTLLWANNLSFSSVIKPGQKLLVPPVSGVIHKVVKGDTVAKIAKQYNALEENIREFNQLDESSNLVVGTNLIVPGGRIVYTPKPRAYADNNASPTRNRNTVNDIQVSGTGSMSWPNGCYRITQYFKGWRHTGVDIACPWGTTVRAADGGRVIRVQYGRTGYGYNVIIDHGDGLQTLYGHLSEIDVEVGQYVYKGQAIAAEGSTGRSTGPHLHFEVRVGGVQVNPLRYVR